MQIDELDLIRVEDDRISSGENILSCCRKGHKWRNDACMQIKLDLLRLAFKFRVTCSLYVDKICQLFFDGTYANRTTFPLIIVASLG